MAHYAIIDERNIVIQVITGVDETITQIDTDGAEVGGSTEAWEAFYTAQLKNPNLYVKRTSYNNNPVDGVSRGKYAGVGDTWNGTKFVSPVVSEPEP